MASLNSQHQLVLVCNEDAGTDDCIVNVILHGLLTSNQYQETRS
jgi:hypothetical protein